MLALTINGTTEHVADSRKDDAMRRYWEAQQAGDHTARLDRVDDTVAANGPMPDPEDDPPAAPGAVSAIAAERVSTQSRWLVEQGFAMEPPVYAPGTRVLPMGDQRFRAFRQQVAALPPFPGAAAAVVGQVRLEKRRDVSVPLRDLALTEHGTLMVGNTEVALEVGAFYQLAAHAGFGIGARYLVERCNTPLRAQNVNTQLQKLPAKVVTLRLRESGAKLPQAFATVTPAYAVVDTDAALSAVGSELDDSRVEMFYDGSGVKATALFMPDHIVDLAAGDVFKVGVRLQTDDTGRGRIRVSAVAWRNRCLNLIVIGVGTVETVSQVHRGDPATILASVTAGVASAREKVADFLASWGHARTVHVDPEETFRQWVAEKRVHVQGAKDRDQVVKHILAAWQQEPGDTLADCVNAVSRAAHETPSWSFDVREEVERQAGQLVLVPR